MPKVKFHPMKTKQPQSPDVNYFPLVDLEWSLLITLLKWSVSNPGEVNSVAWAINESFSSKQNALVNVTLFKKYFVIKLIIFKQ